MNSNIMWKYMRWQNNKMIDPCTLGARRKWILPDLQTKQLEKHHYLKPQKASRNIDRELQNPETTHPEMEVQNSPDSLQYTIS